MTERCRIVIVGGGHAGGRLAQLLSRGPDRVRVTLVGAEPIHPYERPPLSKGVLLGTRGLDDCVLWKPDDAVWGRVETHLGVTVEYVDRVRKNIRLNDGRMIGYDRLVLATGSRIREFSVRGSQLRGVFSLRSYADAQNVSRHFLASNQVAVVGGGFIGLEVAAAAAQRGVQPRVIEASDRLLSRLVPRLVADRLAETHLHAGVQLTYGAMVERFGSNGHGSLKRAVLSNGDVVDCSVAVVAVGVEPEISLAIDAGLEIDVGVKTNEQLRTSDPNIFACGDIAAFWHPLYQRHIRLESWQNAEDHARILAAVLLGEEATAPSVPFFWSDQYDLSLQIMGLPHLGTSTRRKQTASGSSILLHCDAIDRLVGATAIGPSALIGRELRKTRQLIASRTICNSVTLDGAELEVVAD
ncbi:NAD(P)/FAD-dependent oxidoreductase [Bradyrhizobium sp. PMVTL-01]|uniref:NAD(P)/FAD-dependent oxidoreductase n=1 Tax=Bradyrhizobium sp. PMVTL-01 TaxID=3434999 RepID=UPI003F6EE589